MCGSAVTMATVKERNNHTCDLVCVTSKISLAYIFKVTH